MIKSMTGYGRGEALAAGSKFTAELRAVNGKSAEVSIKSAIVPKERETAIKQFLVQTLERGNIDLFVTVQAPEGDSIVTIDKNLARQFLNQASELQAEFGLDQSGLLAAVLRIPEVCNPRKELSQQELEAIESAIADAARALDIFRCKEGARLGEELLSHVDNIEYHLANVDRMDPERIEKVQDRLRQKLSELPAEIEVDRNRFEQELIYYLEKADITEEKVRLKQHCAYFRQTLMEETSCGRKLGFIAQEMGREINTTGSKASHAEIQQEVVKMKDELEKIKEQVLNVL